MISACTIVARNYLPHARILADSFFTHHPAGRFTLLLIDDERREFAASDESFTCVRLRDIGLDAVEIGRLAGIYDVTELATAVKPPLLRYLLQQGSSEVIYLDPDITLYGSLDKAARLAREHSIVLTPHMTSSMPRDGRRIDEFAILAAGIYNLGFIAVGPRSERFIDWWWGKTQREARVDPARMMFTDQRWVDFAPAFFEHFILKDPSYNVAYWNLHERDLTWTGDRYLVNGEPLTFFHFSGFDVRKPYLLSKHQGDRPRILLSERPAVARICREYGDRLERAGALGTPVPYGWNTLPSGLRFDSHMRKLYAAALDRRQDERKTEPPNPFDPAGEQPFFEWLNEPVEPPLFPIISRYLYAIYESRVDLQKAFPDLGSDADRYLAWVYRDGAVQHDIPKRLLPPEPSRLEDIGDRSGTSRQLLPGINIIGYFRAEVGVGEAGRLLSSAVEAAGIAHATVTYDVTPSRKTHPFEERGDRGAPYDVNVLCVNADQTPRFAGHAGTQFFEGRYTAGYWFWELDRFPPSMHKAFDYVDEVWAATRFVSSGIRAIGRRPVHTVPLPIPIPRCSSKVTRATLRLPETFLFLFVFDFFSVLERKNPIGLTQAFDRAFRPGEGPVLVIKTINGARNLTDLEKVRAAAQHRDDILIVDEYYSAEQKNSLLGLCDCYVSLHRSEGFGLTMAEAMGLQKPVIATAYSGNLDFMTAENSYLVGYTTGAVPAGCDPYPVGSPWAEPDLDEAASLMRRVYQAPAEAAQKAARAREDIVTKHNAEAVAVVLRERLDAIRRRELHAVRGGTEIRGSAGAPNTMSDSTPADNPVLASLEHAASLLTPKADAAPDRKLRGPLLAMQNLLLRILRPYWWQQRQIQSILIDALRHVSQDTARALKADPHQRQALEAVWSGIHLLESVAKDDQEWLHQLQERTAKLEERPAQPTPGSPEGLAALQESVATFQRSAAAHLEALTDQLALTTAQATELSQRLYAIPYMHDGERFSYSLNGKRVLGFRGRRTDEGEAYVGFEDIFRGTEPFVQDRLRIYLPLLKRHARVLEIGCGRGEMLDLLREAGVPAIGVDVDEAMVTRCRRKGHAVEQMEGVTYLRDQPDASVPAIFAAQVVEHLAYEELLSFLHLSRAKLAPGGQLIFETVNPHAIDAFKTFWTDLTHQRPIFPEVALAWCWLLGFDQAYVFFPNGSGDLEKDRPSQGEYAVVATSAGER